MSVNPRIALAVLGALVVFALGRLTEDLGADRGDGARTGAGATPTYSGVARVRDGDSLEFSNARVRLFGIDAFELDQKCRGRNGSLYACGHSAKRALETLVRGQIVTCRQKDVDRYDRIVAECRAGDMDLAAEQVRAGWALAYRQFSKRYVPFEKDAKAHERGAWDGPFEEPWDWRHTQRTPRAN